MNQAVVKIAGKQHLVSVGQTLVVDRVEGKAKDKLIFKTVLMTLDGGKVTFGQPLIKDAAVTAEIVAHRSGEKLRVAKFKAKSRYRRVQGHRQRLTELKIVKI